MNPKSNILVQIEILEATQRLKDYTERLMECYNIEDIVLGIVNSQPQELVNGYMSAITESHSLEEALREFNPSKNCIRVTEGKFYKGIWTAKPVVSEDCGRVLRISDFTSL